MQNPATAGTDISSVPRRQSGSALHLQVLAAILAGALLGYVAPGVGAALEPLGDVFIALVKMVIAPVIFLTLVTGIAGMNTDRSWPTLFERWLAGRRFV